MSDNKPVTDLNRPQDQKDRLFGGIDNASVTLEQHAGSRIMDHASGSVYHKHLSEPIRSIMDNLVMVDGVITSTRDIATTGDISATDLTATGDLAVSGDAAITGDLTVTGDIDVTTNKIKTTVTSITGDTVLTTGGIYELAAAGPSGDVTVTLPALTDGMHFLFRNLNTTHNLIISRAGSDTIEGVTTFEIWANLNYTLGFYGASDEWKRTERQLVHYPESLRSASWDFSNSYTSFTDLNMSGLLPLGSDAAYIQCMQAPVWYGTNSSSQITTYFRPDGSAVNDPQQNDSVYFRKQAQAVSTGPYVWYQTAYLLTEVASTMILEMYSSLTNGPAASAFTIYIQVKGCLI